MTTSPTLEIRVLSVKQPWADCLMNDDWVEKRRGNPKIGASLDSSRSQA